MDGPAGRGVELGVPGSWGPGRLGCVFRGGQGAAWVMVSPGDQGSCWLFSLFGDQAWIRVLT